ncbi:glutamyl-tRNA reductase [Nocardioides sp. AE5]|uniref:glutamyl-tRNA reductase n=1 Tax=Nocardioides sp. AE5 TaxID=2962573 RepID=UPI0028823721|nr:glutamyl-tRNA reductase [Nocardioides sp. AE5]MDT0200641.1 glutamyl-tRNA reductase [Nocardioides sp. AE5]
MSILVVGISHRTASVDVLEQLTLDHNGVEKLIADVAACEHVTEATVIATCNRLEIYAEVERFHGSVEELSRLLCERGAPVRPTEELLPNLYVHYGDGAVSHLFHVASGLDSMVVGEGQILGQTRDALRQGQEAGTVGPALNTLFQQALRVGKRSHAETEIDRAAPSMVTAALDLAVVEVGAISGKQVAVVGAGTMAGLATATVARLGARTTVLNRTFEHAERLAHDYQARALPLAELDAVLATADVVISCTGAAGTVVTADQVADARAGNDAPLAFIDLALPRDIDEAVEALPGVTVIGLRRLSGELADSDGAREVAGVRAIVSEEIAAFSHARRQASVTPTVVALRTMATGVVDAEIERLLGRLPDLDPTARAEVEMAVRRVADKLLHQPTTRVKELVNEAGTVSYATALAELFALAPEAVDAVTSVERHP